MSSISDFTRTDKRAVNTHSVQFAYNNNANCKHLMFTRGQNLGVLDTITLSTKDFSLDLSLNQRSKNPLLKHFSDVPALANSLDLILLKDRNGIPVVCDSLRAAEPIRETGILNISRKNENVYLSIQCSVPKFLGKQNIYLANNNDFSCFIVELEKELAESGIFLDVRKCNISRLDVTKNVETRYDFSKYVPLLRKLQFSRDKLNREYNNQTYLMGNGSRVLCCYNKIAEMKAKRESIAGLPNDIFRAEYRALNKTTVRTTYRFKDVEAMEKDFENIESVYKNSLKKNLFRGEVIEDDAEYEEMEIIRRAIKDSGRGKKNFYEAAIMQILVKNSESKLKGICSKADNVLSIYEGELRERGMNSKTIKTLVSRQRRVIADLNLSLLQCIESDIESVSLQDLYNELYEKLIA